jgi:tetratricopeptide (TPR) repeat protein
MSIPPPLHIYRIFLSSTNDPLSQLYRTAAKELISHEFATKWHPLDMKDFHPSSSPPIEVCRQAVLSCHLYVTILGVFYGSVSQKTNVSYTEHEFNIAMEGKREVAVFLLPDKTPADIPLQILAEQGPLFVRQQEFRRRVQDENTGLTVKHVSDLEDFKSCLRGYLNQLTTPKGVSTLVPKYRESSQFIGHQPHLKFDRQPILAHTIEDLDEDLVNILLNQPMARTKLRNAKLVRASVREQLECLGLASESTPTVGGFLCLAPSNLLIKNFSACSLHTVVYSDTRRASAKAKIDETHDNLLNLFDAGMKFLTTEAGLQRTGRIGTSSRDDIEIPELILREALANALIHRDYEHPNVQDQPTRIEVYPDRVEITSFGDLVEGVSEEALNRDTEELIPIRRNDNIARIFMMMQYAELGASGISRMREISKEANLPPPTIIQGKDVPSVKVILRRPPQQPRADRLKVFISSSVLDLPEHRGQVLDACLRMGMFPSLVERLPDKDVDAIALSLNLIDEADLYVCILGHRYGYIPTGKEASIVEMEYDRAVERGIPRLIFLMHEDYPVKLADIETGEGAKKLKKFKERLEVENVVSFFKSPEDLRAHVINSLSQYREQHSKRDVTSFHYVSDIPAPPEAFIAHPYTLLQTHRLVGRQTELNLLTDWVGQQDAEVNRARILSVVAVGGIGKSALTWQWFNKIAQQEMKPLAGRMWWSFYESDATFENFVTRALTYVSRRTLEEIRQIPAPEREAQLLAALDREPYLIVLDGLERVLIAYARMDAARLEDSQVSNQRNLRKTADPRVGRFLKKLAQLRSSRILVSTRLYPAELETEGGDAVPGSFRLDITGLTDEDAVELWRALNVTGSRDLLLPVFNTFGKHPLLIQALAGEVRRYRRAPGNFEAWRKANPRFEPTKFPLLQDAMGHVLEFALRGLDDRELRVLQIIAAFRMPAHHETLAALLIGEGKICVDESELDEALAELEDRGLIGWDKRANRYDLHPIVRRVVWNRLSDDTRRGVYSSLYVHFKTSPMINDWHEVRSLEDLTPAIELYNTLIGLGRYDDASKFFIKRLNDALLYRLGASRQQVELLELLFPDGLNQSPRLSISSAQAFTLNALALGYQFSGRPGYAAPLLRRHNTTHQHTKDYANLSVGLRNISYTLRLLGAIRESEASARRALIIARERQDHFQEAAILNLVGWTLAVRGVVIESESALKRSLRIDAALLNRQAVGADNCYLAQRALWLGEFANALSCAKRAWELAQLMRLERDFIRVARVQGEAALGVNEFVTADERLHHALTRARMVNLVEEELPALVALAELRRKQGDLKAARELLDDVWEVAERGPYPLFHADACNVLAEVERDAGNDAKAVEAATKAYRLAWCDGPPFAYHWGLEKARALLRELGAGEPLMPAFDESKFEAMPEVEIDPADEFGAGGVGGDETGG